MQRSLEANGAHFKSIGALLVLPLTCIASGHFKDGLLELTKASSFGKFTKLYIISIAFKAY